jgi:hypothetical protein
MARLVLSLAVLSTVVLAGCSKQQTPKVPVRGTVTLDKKPLGEGEIVFSTPGKAPEALPIKNGTFEGAVEEGERKVEILAYKDAPAVPMEGEPAGSNKVNYLPGRYNSESQLRATVKPGGSLDLKFDLTSNP